MKRWFSLFLCVVLVSLAACACQAREPSPQETLNFPGLAWGMSPEEALASLSADGAGVQEQDSGSTRSIQYRPEEPLFGLTPEFVQLNFSVSGSDQALTDVLMVYSGATGEHIKTLRDNLSSQYGPLKNYVVLGVTYGPAPSSAPSLDSFQNLDSYDRFYWISSQTYGDLLTPETSAAYQKLLSENGRVKSYWDTQAYWDLYTEFTPVAHIELEGGYNDYYHQYPDGACLIHFSAREYVTLGLEAGQMGPSVP